MLESLRQIFDQTVQPQYWILIKPSTGWHVGVWILNTIEIWRFQISLVDTITNLLFSGPERQREGFAEFGIHVFGANCVGGIHAE